MGQLIKLPLKVKTPCGNGIIKRMFIHKLLYGCAEILLEAKKEIKVFSIEEITFLSHDHKAAVPLIRIREDNRTGD